MHFYKCDPEKNRLCPKRNCYMYGGTCGITSNVECAYDPDADLNDPTYLPTPLGFDQSGPVYHSNKQKKSLDK